MPRPQFYTDSFLDNAHHLVLAGFTLREIAAKLGGTPDLISEHLRLRRGVTYVRPQRPPHNLKQLPADEIVAAHIAGESVKALAKRYGVARTAISNCMKKAGVKPRDRSEAMFVRHQRMTPEQRQQLAEAAHDAVRGKTKAHEHLLDRARAQTRRIGFGEEDFARLLAERGYEVVPQAPIDIYNVDLLVGGTVAVELRCDSALPPKLAYGSKRIKALLEAGCSVLYVLFKEIGALMALADEVIADIDALRGHPSPLREYRVVRCASHRFARVRNELGQLTAVPTPVRYTRSLCVSKVSVPG